MNFEIGVTKRIIILKYIKFYIIDNVELRKSDVIELRLEDNSEVR